MKTHPNCLTIQPPASAFCLPLIGPEHPLRRRQIAMLYRAFAAAALLHLTAFAAFLISPHGAPPVAADRVIKIRFDQIPLPPSIHPTSPAPSSITVAIQAAVGTPVPVPDLAALDTRLIENAAMVDAINALTPSGLQGITGESVKIELPPERSDAQAAPADFAAIEEAPVLITFPAPPYPSLARQAEVEGCVRLKLLVGVDGRVKDVVVLEGVAMLNEAAVEAAHHAVFKPALQQNRPVAVWVELPISFRLND